MKFHEAFEKAKGPDRIRVIDSTGVLYIGYAGLIGTTIYSKIKDREVEHLGSYMNIFDKNWKEKGFLAPQEITDTNDKEFTDMIINSYFLIVLKDNE